MRRGVFPGRCLPCALAAGLSFVVVANPSLARAEKPLSHPQPNPWPIEYTTTVDYVAQFYPLWFTYNQSKLAVGVRLVGPERISPLYHAVVAINDDTLYASTVLDLTLQPVILTIPATTSAYSVLTLDPYCDIFESHIPSQPPGTLLPATTYALTGPGFVGALPPGVTPIAMPFNISTLIFRVDKYSPSGENQIAQAEVFRGSIKCQTLCDYEHVPCPGGVPHDESGGSTLILPELAFSVPFKSIADGLIADDPITFLQQLQTAVLSSNTPPFTPYEQELSDTFNSLFGTGQFDLRSKPDRETATAFAAGAQAAHALIVDRYLSHTGPTGWITFTNIGDWGTNVIERSAITEFIQYGNGHSTAAYYHTFQDDRGKPLNGNNPHGYVLNFPADQLPQAKRFWSITAYTPDAIELVSNPINKYVVASYTSGLQTNMNGSLSIYMATEQPAGVPLANWLPVPKGDFNIMLRFYGPEGSVTNNTYVPPAIRR